MSEYAVVFDHYGGFAVKQKNIDTGAVITIGHSPTLDDAIRVIANLTQGPVAISTITAGFDGRSAWNP